jgi:hypothetical protein
MMRLGIGILPMIESFYGIASSHKFVQDSRYAKHDISNTF